MERKLLFGLLLLCMSSQIDALTKPSSIKFESNAYSGIVVAIHRDIPENLDLIERIKVGSKLTLSDSKGVKDGSDILLPRFARSPLFASDLRSRLGSYRMSSRQSLSTTHTI